MADKVDGGTEDPEWGALLREAYEASNDLPIELMTLCAKFGADLSRLGNDMQISPRRMAAAISIVIGWVSMAEVGGDVNAEDHFNDFIQYVHAAVHMGVAKALLDTRAMRAAKGDERGDRSDEQGNDA